MVLDVRPRRSEEGDLGMPILVLAGKHEFTPEELAAIFIERDVLNWRDSRKKSA